MRAGEVDERQGPETQVLRALRWLVLISSGQTGQKAPAQASRLTRASWRCYRVLEGWDKRKRRPREHQSSRRRHGGVFHVFECQNGREARDGACGGCNACTGTVAAFLDVVRAGARGTAHAQALKLTEAPGLVVGVRSVILPQTAPGRALCPAQAS